MRAACVCSNYDRYLELFRVTSPGWHRRHANKAFLDLNQTDTGEREWTTNPPKITAPGADPSQYKHKYCVYMLDTVYIYNTMSHHRKSDSDIFVLCLKVYTVYRV